MLMCCPELLYALNEKKLESELFDEDGNLKWDAETGEPLGEWDKYFGSNSNIRPFLFIPDTQTESKHYVCYQVGFTNIPKHNTIEKYNTITFTIFVHGDDRIDKLTGIPRHDLIAAIIQEQINWTNLFGTKCKIVSDKESMTDTDYIVRTFVLETVSMNSITKTENGSTKIVNNIGKI